MILRGMANWVGRLLVQICHGYEISVTGYDGACEQTIVASLCNSSKPPICMNEVEAHIASRKA